MRTGLFIQARSGSTRYPGKIFQGLPEQGAPSVIEHIYSRLKNIRGVDVCSVLVPENDARLIEFLMKKNIPCFTGSEDDVRQRYRDAAVYYDTDIVVRATGDNPCVDPVIAADTLDMISRRTGLDLFSFYNLPLGVAVEAFRRKALLDDSANPLPEYKEHVSLHIKKNPKNFRILHADHPLPFHHSENLPRLTLDTAEDLEVIRNVFRRLGSEFLTADVLRLHKQEPELFMENSHVIQKIFV